MLNFKQFLLEEDLRMPWLVLSTGISENDLQNDYNYTADELKNTLEDEFTHAKIDPHWIQSFSINLQDNEYELAFAPAAADYNGNIIPEKINKILGVVRDVFDYREFEFSNVLVVLRDKINFKVKFDIVTVYLPVAPHFKTLTGLDKMVECPNLSIGHPSMVQGNVLSILKIKGLTKFWTYDNKRINGIQVGEKWVPIVQKYLGGSILDCQEELIQNGLKQYAKL